MKKIISLFCIILLLTAGNLFAQEKEFVEEKKEPIRVGVFLDMTGQISMFGIATHNGVKLAVDEIDALGGINGRKLEIFLEDDTGRPEQARRVVEKLVSEDKVHAIIGEVASTNSLAAAPVAQEAKIPMISPSSTNPRVNER